jgi:hypothetical protein
LLFKILVFLSALVLLYGFFIGCEWQAETALINEHNQWSEFAWLLQSVKMTNWQAWDLFLGLLDAIAWAMALVAFSFGWWLRGKLKS